MRGTDGSGSGHFEIASLAEGVFAAIATDGGSAISNSGVIDLGGRTLVYDTFLTPRAAGDLRRTVEGLLGPAPSLVVNSHYHNDHVWGNQAFAPDAPIVASRRTRELLATAGVDELEWYRANSGRELASLRAQFQAADEERRNQLLLWIGYYEGLVDDLPRLGVCLPTIAYEDHLEICGSRHVAELIAYRGAHTESDTVLHLADLGIVFTGDLLFVGCHPYLGDGDPLQLLKVLSDLNRLGAARFIPGHGPTGSSADVNLMIEYVEHCRATAQALVDRGLAPGEPLPQPRIPEKFSRWRVGRFYEANIRRLFGRLCQPAGGSSG